jgi:AcrR family transcriptional regulator
MSPRSKNQNQEIRETSIQNIVSAAKKLFVTEGYLNVSVDKIAKNANVSKGLLYNYFSGKEALLEYIIDQLMTGMSKFSKEIYSENDPGEKLKLTIQLTFKLMSENADFWKTVMPVITQKAITLKMEAKLKLIFNQLTKDLTMMFKALGSKEPEMEAYLLGAVLDGIAWQYFFLNDEHYPLSQVKKALLRKYLK